MATPNMSLDLPSVTTEDGPTWATKLNAALTKVDAHDHTSGKGLPIPTAGIDIDADLPFGTYNATELRSVRFAEQGVPFSASPDLGCLYNVLGDLYWSNGDGTAVQITDGNSLSATSLGGISGLPSGTASAAFSGATFTWRSATNQAATMDGGPVVIRDTASLALGITLQSPVGLAGAYSLTLPTALPGASSFLVASGAGVLSYLTQTAGITRPMLASVGQQVSASCGASPTPITSTSFTSLTNLAVTITTTGRPVFFMLESDDSGATGGFVITNASTTNYRFVLRANVTGTATAQHIVGLGAVGVAGTDLVTAPPSALTGLLVLAAGTYTITAQARVVDAFGNLAYGQMKLVAWEL